MTAYDLSDLIGARTGFGLAKTHLDNMRVKTFATSSVSSTSSSSASYVNLISLNLTGILTTDLIYIVASSNISSGTAARYARMRLQLTGAGNGQDHYEYCSIANTAGTEHRSTIHRLETGLSGTVTADFQWRYDGSATTLYADQRYIIAMVFKSAQ